MQNPQYYFDISIGSIRKGRLVFELYQDLVPLTVHHFLSFDYSNTIIDRLIPRFGLESSYIYHDDKPCNQENCVLKHSNFGCLSRIKPIRNKNGSRFFINLNNTSWLDNEYIVFGQLIIGKEFLREIERHGTANGTLISEVKIEACGLIII